jgi:hypothetical protein
VTKERRKGILTTAAVVALPFTFAGNARASPGSIIVDYHVDSPYTHCSCGAFHYPGVSEGIDSCDGDYGSMFNPFRIAAITLREIPLIHI